MSRMTAFLIGLALAACCSHCAQADTFGSGAHAFEIELVTIGAPGNAADTTGAPNPAGAVAYPYRIGKYEISERMIDAANALGGLGITQSNRGPDKPATDVSWFEAAQFVNWLNTSTGHAAAYKFDGAGAFQLWTPADAGYDPANLFRNARAKYFLPSMDEWYKAAFYDPQAGVYWDYPNGRDTPPQPVASGTDDNTAVYNQAGPADVYLAGGPSPFGTVGQVGNVAEWDETEADLVNDDVLGNRGIRGASWLTLTTPLGISSSFRVGIQSPAGPVGNVGFRIASTVSEPTSLALATILAAVVRIARTTGAVGGCSRRPIGYRQG